MFKKPVSQNASKALRNTFVPNKPDPSSSTIQATPIRRTDYRRIDPSLAAPIQEPEPPKEQVLVGEELQNYLNAQKKKHFKNKEDAAEHLMEEYETTDPQVIELQSEIDEQIISSAALALSKLPIQKQRLVIDLINQLREDI